MPNPDTDPDGVVPPYIAFKTLIDITERMAREGAPSQIDRSYLDNYAGGYQTQVIAALRSLSLLGEGGILSERLKALVQGSEQDRKNIIAEMVREHYASVLSLGTNATQQQLVDAFTAMKVNGDTRRKAIAFFLRAAQFGGVPTSPHWKTPRVPPAGKRSPATTTTGVRANPVGSGMEEASSDSAGELAGMKHSVSLASGGTVSVHLTVDLFAMNKRDRDFVLELVDKLRSYEDQRALPAGPAPSDAWETDEEEDEAQESPVGD